MGSGTFISKIIIFGVVSLIGLSLLGIFLAQLPTPQPKKTKVTSTATNETGKNQAIEKAKAVYKDKKEANTDFTKGPCISDNLMPDWVADIAHNPRIAIDDLEQNQCPSFVDGSTHHFVELDPDGNLIRVQ